MRVLTKFNHTKAVLNNRCYSLHFKYDGRLLASAGEDKTVKIWLFDIGKAFKIQYPC